MALMDITINGNIQSMDYKRDSDAFGGSNSGVKMLEYVDGATTAKEMFSNEANKALLEKIANKFFGAEVEKMEVVITVITNTSVVEKLVFSNKEAFTEWLNK